MKSGLLYLVFLIASKTETQPISPYLRSSLLTFHWLSPTVRGYLSLAGPVSHHMHHPSLITLLMVNYSLLGRLHYRWVRSHDVKCELLSGSSFQIYLNLDLFTLILNECLFLSLSSFLCNPNQLLGGPSLIYLRVSWGGLLTRNYKGYFKFSPYFSALLPWFFGSTCQQLVHASSLSYN